MRAIFCGLVASLTLMGCSKKAEGEAASADAGAAATPDAPVSKDDACTLLSLSDVKRILPQATRVERNESLKEYGISGCGWYASSGKAPVVEVTVWLIEGADDTPTSNANTLAMGVADPTRAGAQASVRLEKVSGVGEEAIAIVEKADDTRGILTTSAWLTFSKNGRIATVASGYIPVEDRAKAMEQLATLGKSIAARL